MRAQRHLAFVNFNLKLSNKWKDWEKGEEKDGCLPVRCSIRANWRGSGLCRVNYCWH